MFRPQEAWATGSASYSLAGSTEPGAPALASFGRRGYVASTAFARLRHTWLLSLKRFTQPVDLAENIGSRQWFGGLALLLTLSAVALSFWPDLALTEQASAAAYDNTVRDEYRSRAIAPLSQSRSFARLAAQSARVVDVASVPDRPTLQRSLVVASGDSLTGLLQRGGISGYDAASAASLISQVTSGTPLAAGTRLELIAGKRDPSSGARPLERITLRARIDLGLVISRQGGALTAQQMPMAVNTEPLRIRGKISGSLYHSARTAGAPMSAIQQYLQTLGDHISLDEGIADGGEFDMVVAYRRAPGGMSETGKLLYAGLTGRDGTQTQLLRMGDNGGFIDAARPESSVAGTFNAPVNGRITSGFGMRRHPVLGYVRMHGGVDFAAAWGSPIRAAADAIVDYAGWHGGHGLFVRLSHGGGLGTGYGHMSQLAVSPGARVQAGQVIGYVGSTGLSTGPHLHYEMYQGGQRINPLGGALAVAAQPDPSQMAEIKARLVHYMKIVPGAALKPL